MKEKTLTSKNTATTKIAALLALKLSKEKSAYSKQAPDKNHFAGPDGNERFQALIEKNRASKIGGGYDRINRQHAKGKLTARERIDYLLDPGTFEEIDRFVTHRTHDFDMQKKKYLGDGVISGYGKIQNRLVCIYSQDFTVLGGSLSETHAKKICKIMDLALKAGVPLIGLNDSGGARIQEGVKSLAGYADIFYRNVKLSGKIPQISAIMGPCAGGAVYSPALTDFTIMVKDTSYMFVTGPNVVKTVTYEDITAEALGGAQTHAQKSGVAHLTAENDYQCLDKIRKILSYLPQNCNGETIEIDYTAEDELRLNLDHLVPENPRRPYDVRMLLDEICDKESLLEIQEDYAKNIFVGFGRLAGKSIGIVANQPLEKAGCLDVACSQKAARFVRTCDCYNIPLLVLVDVPGFLPGKEQEWNGIIKHGAKLLYAFCEATTPRISVITRKAYGGAYDVMNSKHIGADMNFAWPGAEIAVMGAKGASEIVFKKEILAAENPEEKQLELEREYAEKFANPYCAANLGFIDEVIFPHETRIKLIKAFELVREKDSELILKKHGNIPL